MHILDDTVTKQVVKEDWTYLNVKPDLFHVCQQLSKRNPIQGEEIPHALALAPARGKAQTQMQRYMQREMREKEKYQSAKQQPNECF
jgi:hypothetical protein